MNTVSENIQHRYEQKFVFNNKQPAFVEKIVKAHPANFHEIFKQRRVNNIYFDKPELKYYSDHKVGNGNRKKVRIRWYGNTLGLIVRPVLEFKIREGEIRIKKSYALPEFEIEKGFGAQQLKELFAKAKLPEEVHAEIEDLEAILMNSYRRRYFRSSSKQYRFTIDHKLEYYKFLQEENLFSHKELDSESVILELKFSLNYFSESHFINEKLPIKMSDFSKYVSGMEKLNSNLVH